MNQILALNNLYGGDMPLSRYINQPTHQNTTISFIDEILTITTSLLQYRHGTLISEFEMFPTRITPS